MVQVCNNHSSPGFAKSDRFLVSIEWDDLSPLSYCTTLPSHISDHVPIILDDKQAPHISRLFRFDQVWLEKCGFRELVIQKWAECIPNHELNGAEKLVFKLRSLRSFLKKWSGEHFGSVCKKKLAMLDRINMYDTIQETRVLTQTEMACKGT